MRPHVERNLAGLATIIVLAELVWVLVAMARPLPRGSDGDLRLPVFLYLAAQSIVAVVGLVGAVRLRYIWATFAAVLLFLSVAPVLAPVLAGGGIRASWWLLLLLGSPPVLFALAAFTGWRRKASDSLEAEGRIAVGDQ
ncbi:MAG: hypothetical protein ACYC33_11305 [Thermoleophilia bacterium]